MFVPIAALAIYWFCFFLFFGMYRERYADSRFDELVSVGKVVSAGVLVLVFAIFIDTLEAGATRSLIFFYWAVTVSFVACGRVTVRSVQKGAACAWAGRSQGIGGGMDRPGGTTL